VRLQLGARQPPWAGQGGAVQGRGEAGRRSAAPTVECQLHAQAPGNRLIGVVEGQKEGIALRSDLYGQGAGRAKPIR